MRNPSTLLVMVLGTGLLAVAGGGCSSDGIDSNEEARRAYLGLDKSIAKSLTLGLAGFSAATSANIAPQMASGDKSGTLTITGQVDQGASDNKGLRLRVGMVMFSDGDFVIDDKGNKISITYDTATEKTAQPALDLSLRNIPTGTFTGTLVGTYYMTGAIKGEATLNLMFSGTLQSNGGTGTQRAPGTTTVTGTAKSGDGQFTVNLMI